MGRLKKLLHTTPHNMSITQQDTHQLQPVVQHGHTAQQVLLHVVHPSLCNTQQTVSDTDPPADYRRQRVLAMLANDPALRLAVVCDGTGDPIPVAVAIRHKGTVEVLIPAARFDPFTFLDLVERHNGLNN